MNLKPNRIPGIYNYCDRWCERCYFISRCAIYENPNDIPSEEKDINNKAFWDKLKQNFQNTFELLHKAAAEHGLDLNNIPPEETAAYEKKDKETLVLMKKHPLSKISMEYMVKTKKILENNQLLKIKSEELISHLEMGIRTKEQTLEDASLIRDYLEIIHWYVHFIHVKFQRALHGKIEDDGWEIENGFQRDFDGSAKIALIAVERSMEAWLGLVQQLPGIEDDVLHLLALLEKMKKTGEREFPEAKKFKRPGFDELASSRTGEF